MFSGICMANTDVQFVYNHSDLDRDQSSIRRDNSNKTLTEDKINWYVDKYCIGDYAKYKDIIKSDTDLLVNFVWFQSYKYMSLIGRFREGGSGIEKLSNILGYQLSEVLSKGWQNNSPMSAYDIRKIFLSGRASYVSDSDGIEFSYRDWIDHEAEVVVAQFWRILCYLPEYKDNAELFEQKRQFVDLLRKDVLDTFKAHYKNLLEFVKDNYNGDKLRYEFVIKWGMCTLIGLKSDSFDVYDFSEKKPDEIKINETKKIENDLCDELMGYLNELGQKQFGTNRNFKEEVSKEIEDRENVYTLEKLRIEEACIRAIVDVEKEQMRIREAEENK